jgi:hypothetical protein
MKSYIKRFYRLATARYLVSARWGVVQVHPARDFGEAMRWVSCYPDAPISILKRSGLFKFKVLGTFN